jgi:SAPK-interacting protein 1 (Sin1), middle CRIM domain
MDPNGIKLQIFVPSCREPTNPIFICVKSDTSVEEVIGFALFEYVNENRQPAISEKLKAVTMWNLRIVEDDGEVDDDFPGLSCLIRSS